MTLSPGEKMSSISCVYDYFQIQKFWSGAIGSRGLSSCRAPDPCGLCKGWNTGLWCDTLFHQIRFLCWICELLRGSVIDIPAFRSGKWCLKQNKRRVLLWTAMLVTQQPGCWIAVKVQVWDALSLCNRWRMPQDRVLTFSFLLTSWKSCLVVFCHFCEGKNGCNSL